ncbi:MAG TPA: DEAD/DEAH box helicase [Candidatus Binatia bacterium]|nr:DEAD/DEAH box helicase [Candidatus Binatia bacterium]
MITLREYQQRALSNVRAAISERGQRRVCLVAPTGSGKTLLGTSWLSGYTGVRGAPLLHNDTGLWIVHRRELLTDARNAIARVIGGNSVGFVGAGAEPGHNPRIRVATIQTLLARGERPAASRIVLDEVHHFVASNLWSTLLEAYPDAAVVGLTATPERQDGQALGDVFSELVVAARYPDLVREGHLVDCQAYAPIADTGAGLARDPVETYLSLGQGERAFMFCTRVDVAEDFAKQFCDAGVEARCISERTRSGDRKEWLDAFTAGEIRVLTNVYTLTEGVDVPAARVCIFARKFNHEGPYLQCAGRVLRPFPGKPDAIIIDLMGSVLRFGLPTEDRVYSLDGRAIQRATPSLRQCPECGAVYPGSPAVCERCGFAFPPPGSEPAPAPRIYDIELKRVFAGGATPDGAKQREWIRLAALCRERGWDLTWGVKEYQKLFPEETPELAEDERRQIFRDLVKFQNERGYKKSFAAVRFKSLLGKWPPTNWIREELAA